ncbi:Nedd4 interacting protein [Lobosporangium transversale]|uniref:Metal homeostatis protein bsd2 n=1 Tax=Lobosporangium transversale TaxID=64571 RepID=A0A1Y2G8U4_9FUNG|nr:hypothetical protein BCR41DRAFT_390963 [Lobosporangium transversale]KAF9913854.1 Nedd4 interacting protein [Lobosporangium transversale]ORY92978.1 hypothetical protein BCR41DRAFT_390963 [Lobosporangium transversale]|eukprot:XP_021875135.1 hypothetical protein BCR41DRAFT_390963 [Lobosporangium transversale]
MSRAHSYAQIPLMETSATEARDHDTHNNDNDNDTNHRRNLAIARSQKSSRNSNRNNDHRGYATLRNTEDDGDEDDELENAGENSVMLRPMASSSSTTPAPTAASGSSSSSGSAPRRHVYSTNSNSDDEDDHDQDNEISIAPPAETSSSNIRGSTATSTTKRSGARTTNMSFLARLTGRQRPERDAQRMVRSAVDGVFSNLSAKPRVEKPYEEELPPAYKTAALDVSPAYHETNLPPGFTDEDDMLLVEGLPVGGLLGFMWNMIISVSFQFVGFFLTYLLHTSHATKEGSKTGLGITLVSMGYKMMTGRFPDGSDDDVDPSEDSDTGYMGNPGNSGYYSPSSLRRVTDYEWLSYILLMLGMAILVQSVSSFTRVKLSEIRIQLAAHSATHAEATVSGSAAAGASSSSTSTSGEGRSGTVVITIV